MLLCSVDKQVTGDHLVVSLYDQGQESHDSESKSFVGFFPQPAYYLFFLGSKVHLKAMYI